MQERMITASLRRHNSHRAASPARAAVGALFSGLVLPLWARPGGDLLDSEFAGLSHGVLRLSLALSYLGLYTVTVTSLLAPSQVPASLSADALALGGL